VVHGVCRYVTREDRRREVRPGQHPQPHEHRHSSTVASGRFEEHDGERRKYGQHHPGERHVEIDRDTTDTRVALIEVLPDEAFDHLMQCKGKWQHGQRNLTGLLHLGQCRQPDHTDDRSAHEVGVG